MTAYELMLLYLGWIGVFVLSIVLGYLGVFDHLGRKRK